MADMRHGGFGGAPKFPPAAALELLLARGVTDVVEVTLDAMAHGGIYDQIGGGFARYSVDDVWLVPHFEKMLYDNALLARAYLHGWQALGHERWRRVCEETLDLGAARDARAGGRLPLRARRRLRGRGGALLRLDARTRSARRSRPPASATLPTRLIAYYGVTREGNFEGRNILHLPGGPAAPSRRRASTRRGGRCTRTGRGRVWPAKDDKRLCLVERADDRRPRRGRRRPALRRLPGRRRSPAPSSSGATSATSAGACCAPTATARPGSPPTSRTTRTWSRRC